MKNQSIGEDIRVLNMWQPWGSALGKCKHIETRSPRFFGHSYRGLLAIYATGRNAAKSPFQSIHLLQDDRGLPKELENFVLTAHELPKRCFISVARMTDSFVMVERSQVQKHWHQIGEGKWREELPKKEVRQYIEIESVSRMERCLGDWQPGRYALIIEQVVSLPELIPHKGCQTPLVKLAKIRPDVAQKLIDIWSLEFGGKVQLSLIGSTDC